MTNEKINILELNNAPLQLISSGLNKHFLGWNLDFADYVQQMRHVISRTRIDLKSANAEKILEANSPFILQPTFSPSFVSTANHWQKGALLIHGLFDSPFTLREIGIALNQEGFYVQAILLPGHGTVPGDLLEIRYTEWLKAVEYGIATLKQKVDQVYLVGYSLGAVLALHHALQNDFIKGLFLIGPALSLHKRLTNYLRCYQLLFGRATVPRWYRRNSQHTYARYESFASNAAFQAFLLIQNTQRLLAKQNLTIPLLLAASEDDEIVCPQALQLFFSKQTHSANRMLFYSNSSPLFNDPRILWRTSTYPDLKIVNFSHICLPFAPHNSHYGQHGDYQDFQHYHYRLPSRRPIYLGAAHRRNLRRYTIQRLGYNPDFAFMIENLKQLFCG